MKNPWKSRPLYICITPVVGLLLQVIILGFTTGMTGDIRRTTLINLVTLSVLFFPVVSIPALAAAVGDLKAKAMRGWSIAGIVLNSAYCLLLALPILSLVTFFIHGSRR